MAYCGCSTLDMKEKLQEMDRDPLRRFFPDFASLPGVFDGLDDFPFVLSATLVESVESFMSSSSFTLIELALDLPVPLALDLPTDFGDLPFALDDTFGVSCFDLLVFGVSCFDLEEVLGIPLPPSLDFPDLLVSLASFLDLLADFEAASTDLPLLFEA
ncbi:hypothetical protein OWV82_017854 [Melia azedarach]|uniref:Uncharacterized protein n=1 Tax=Melia azedarach TaxID=155640 RepID=A0ACC1X8V2_MELAZ|nr:hypothetical protein OWV82_017854 [Melia azedarach]